MGLRWVTCAVVLAVVAVIGCVEPKLTHCPEVDCPKDMVCDGQGGCALPQQLEQCNGQADGTACSYTNNQGQHVDGSCNHNVCVPVGCGNFLISANEVCDDGNTMNGDGCSADCLSDETCGNSVVDPARGEQCDDGNAIDGDGCQHDCKNPRCGDGIKDVTLNEECDEGTANSLNPDAACRPNCQFPRCGDGVKDPQRGEVCDDGNNNPGDGCAGDCKSNETCGNAVVDVFAGEVCDDGNTASNDGCRGDCKSTEACGNGVVDTARGEVCDDGNIVSGDGCSSDCRSLEVCGNSIVDTIYEQCDLGTMNSNLPDSGCRTNCKLPACGDGIKDPMHNEQCDDGMMNANVADACRTNCQLPRCGDTIKDATEACDDGNYLSGDGCSGDCRSSETCGNGYIDTAKGEQCDAGALNSNAPNAPCRTDCKLPRCGDGAIDTSLGETCDAGTANSNLANAACRTNCQPQRCADGILDNLKGEICDDGNVVSGDGCSADCKSNETCGNGVLDAAKGEQCDAGTLNSNLANAPCRTNCTLPRCGDNAVDTNLGEACDLGTANSNLANATCRTNCQPQRCGDTIIDSQKGEICDDGNSVAGDGCSPDCKSNETCGNGIVDVAKGEQCDAASLNSNLANAPCRTDCKLPRCGDGAVDTVLGEACDAGASNSNAPNASCRTNCQPARCGDTVLDNLHGEICDDGNAISGDGCSADCKSTEVCGNGIVDSAKGEKCDDGNTVNTDFCHNNCTLPTCGDGILDYNEQCDMGSLNSNAPNSPCRTNCLLRRCGDLIVDTATEVCDDGNLVAGDGCSVDCKSNETCGNGVLDFTVGEVCDDGNTRGRDGCSKCKAEDVVVLWPGNRFQFHTYNTLAYDAARQRVVAFYGNSRETWEWDGVSWMQMRPRTSPPSRGGQAMAYDPLRHRIVIFGGYNNGYKNDTWEFDGNDWVDKTPAVSPNPRQYTAMAFDANRKTIVLYGGEGTSVNDTWEWNGATWTKLTTTGTPGTRAGHRLIWDAVRNNLVLYGGPTDGTHTWTFNGTTLTWTDRGFAPAGYPTDYSMYMAFDPNRAAVVLWRNNGVTYEWNGTAWSSVAGATPQAGNGLSFTRANEGDMAYDAARGQLVLAGGDGYDTNNAWQWMNDTWLRTGTTWTKAAAWVNPGDRPNAHAAYDPLRGKLVLFGGLTTWCSYCSPFPNVVNTTWEFDGRKWTQIAASTPPSARTKFSLDYNTSNNTIMLFGGQVYNGSTWTKYADLYQYAPTTWSVPALSTGRAGIQNSAMAYDRANNKVVTFGGDNGNLLQDTYTWDATNGWLLKSPTTKPAPRRSHALVYDPVRKRIVLYGGLGSSFTQLSDTWEWDGTSWTTNDASGPSGRRGHSLVFNGDDTRTVLYGANEAGGTEDLWEWDGTTWTRRAVDNPIGANYKGATIFDAAHHQLVVYGGKSNAQDTIFLRYRPYVTTEACTFANLDYDNDGLAGCADPDCWSVCAPLCPPGATGCPSTPRCGDGVCQGVESCDICPSDCTTGCPAQQCGDFRCSGTETRSSCPSDCYQ